jgi:hypothetical protein
VIVARLKPRNCRQCGERFMPDRLGQTIHKECVYPFALKLIKKKLAAKAKTERAQTRARKEAIQTIPELIKVAQREFNAWVRKRDEAKPCICCGRTSDDKDLLTGSRWDAGHYRSTGSASHLRFNEDNCHRQLVHCNRHGAGRAVDYRIGLIARIGIEAVEALESSNEPHKWTREELRAIAATYKQKRKELEDRE